MKMTYFGMQAEMGITKHMGGKVATDTLVNMCDIKKGDKVLNIGCGIGTASVYLAKKGMHVTGIDINPKMVRHAKDRAKRKGMEKSTKFVVADAQSLPFKTGEFDAVVMESVMVFVPNKQKAMKEIKRVLKKGGSVGLNEVTWKKKPPQRIVDYIHRAIGGIEPLTKGGWIALFEKAGFTKVQARTPKESMLSLMLGELTWLDPMTSIKAGIALFKMMFRKEVWGYVMGMFPLQFDIMDYYGYGLYAGKK
ncbi:class I SAM-dependent methyltransferase [archaeon]